MVKEAEANKEADKKKKEEADTKNEAEQMIFQTEKALKDLGDKVEEKEKPTTKKCPYCFSEIDIHATRCPHCTSVIEDDNATEISKD